MTVDGKKAIKIDNIKIILIYSYWKPTIITYNPFLFKSDFLKILMVKDENIRLWLSQNKLLKIGMDV